jgi:SSS family solute:Na+ symporter
MMSHDSFPFILAGLYFVALLAVGYGSGRKKGDSNQYLNATGSLPLWVSITACVAANCGSMDVFVMMALGAQYGMLACHFYWSGAVPALLVLAFWLLPAYARGHYPTILDFIEHYYGRPTRTLAALGMAVMMMLLAGVCLYAVTQALACFLGWSVLTGMLVTAPLVLLYTWAGGFRATVYTEILHFAVVLAAIVPLFLIMMRSFGGFSHWLAAIPAARLHTWKTLPLLDPGAPMDRFGVFFGLLLVLSLSYWGTDFVQMQRALSVRRPEAVPAVPLSLATAKMLFAFLVVLPGITAPLVLFPHGQTNWNATLPMLMMHYFSPLGMTIGVMGITASLVSTFANNVAGFNSVWVQSIYRPWLHCGASEQHYLWVSKLSNAAAVVLSIGTAYLALNYANLMEYIQMILATFNAPIFALVSMGAILPGRVRRGGLGALAVGLSCGIIHHCLVCAGFLHYGSRMAEDFYAAVLGFSVTTATALLLHRLRSSEDAAETRANAPARVPLRFTPATISWAAALAASFCLLTFWFW